MGDVVDPRVARTREKILEAVRRLLTEQPDQPITFSALSREAQVSRKTLYAHWDDVLTVIRESLNTAYAADGPQDLAQLTPEQILRGFLKSFRATMGDHLALIAVSSLVGQASLDAGAEESLIRVALAPYEQFRLILGPISQEDFGQLIGPLLFSQYMLRRPASDELIEVLVRRGLELLASGSTPAEPVVTTSTPVMPTGFPVVGHE